MGELLLLSFRDMSLMEIAWLLLLSCGSVAALLICEWARLSHEVFASGGGDMLLYMAMDLVSPIVASVLAWQSVVSKSCSSFASFNIFCPLIQVDSASESPALFSVVQRVNHSIYFHFFSLQPQDINLFTKIGLD